MVPQVAVSQAAVEDAVLALVVLEWKKRAARDAVRQAVASLSSRGEAIDAGALTGEALRQSPGPRPVPPRDGAGEARPGPTWIRIGSGAAIDARTLTGEVLVTGQSPGPPAISARPSR